MGYFTNLIEASRKKKKISTETIAKIMGMVRSYYAKMVTFPVKPRSTIHTNYKAVAELLEIDLFAVELACCLDRGVIEIDVSKADLSEIKLFLDMARQIHARKKTNGYRSKSLSEVLETTVDNIKIVYSTKNNIGDTNG